MMIKKLACFVVLTVFVVSCLDDPDCYDLNNTTIGVSFRKMADNRADTVALISVVIEGTDSVFHNNRLVSGIQLPLNYLAGETIIYFRQPDGEDTRVRRLVLSHTVKAQYVSEDCGERFEISNLAVVDSEFDSTQLVTTMPTRTPSTSVILYRCPITNFARMGFRQLRTDTVSLGYPMNVSLQGITTDYLPEIFYEDQTVSSVRLPVNEQAGTTEFTFAFEDGSSKAITLAYRTVELQRYLLCGVQQFYTDIEVPQSEFPLFKIVKDSIQDPPTTNITFFRCPDTHFVRIQFKESAAVNAPNKTVAISKITTDFTGEEFYVDTSTSAVELPLNENADVTTFSFELEDGVKTMEVRYSRTPKVYHKICDQTEFSVEQLVSPDFTAAIIEKQLKYPAVTNVTVVIN